MPRLKKSDTVSRVTYRPEQRFCSTCQSLLKRDHILWRKYMLFSTGAQVVTSWAYRCSRTDCPGAIGVYRSAMAEKLHLRQRRFSRELVVRVGYRRFWQHQTLDELHAWLTQDLQLVICRRAVANLLLDFLALLCAAQPARIREQLGRLPGLLIAIDGMQPEKGNDCLYIVRELQCRVTLLAVNLVESSQEALCEQVFAPLQVLAQERRLPWQGVVSDAQETIRLAVAQSLPGVSHQACQAHCLREAGQLTFEADRAMKKQLKASFRQALPRLRKRIQALPAVDPFRPVLLDYTAALRSVLLEGGVAPFELGGIRAFDALAALESSVLRCQKKGITSCCAGCSPWQNVACPSPLRLNAIGGSGRGSSTWSTYSIRSAIHPKAAPALGKPWSIT